MRAAEAGAGPEGGREKSALLKSASGAAESESEEAPAAEEEVERRRRTGRGKWVVGDASVCRGRRARTTRRMAAEKAATPGGGGFKVDFLERCGEKEGRNGARRCVAGFVGLWVANV